LYDVAVKLVFSILPSTELLTHNARLAINNDWPAEEGWALYLVTLKGVSE